MLFQRVAILALLCCACQGGQTPVADGGPADLSGGGCHGGDADAGVCLASASGRIVDENGAPLAQALVSVCGNICFVGNTDANGAFTIAIRRYLILETYALLVHGRPDRATFYLPLPAPADDMIVFPDPLPLLPLPPAGPSLSQDQSAQVLTQGDVTLSLAAGTKVKLDIEDVIALPLGGELRTVARVPASGPIAPAGAAALYGLTPFEVTFSQKATLTFANAAHLPPGTAVDVLEQDGLVSGRPGAFERVAGAHVSADGTQIVFDPGDGVTTLTWIALKPR